MRKPRKKFGAGYRSFATLHEDEHILVVSKPGGLLTNMAEHGEPTLQDQLADHFKGKPIAAHRLDRFTSGLVIFGRTKLALEKLGAMMRDNAIEKSYWVLVVGTPEPKQGSIEAPLERFEHPRKKMRVAETEHAQPAHTVYSTSEELRGFTLLEAGLHTGRTHQLRVHFAHIGTPVAGDNIYWDKSVNHVLRAEHGLQRQFIHARSLRFKHPVTGESLDLRAKLPKDLSRVLKSLRQKESPE